MTAPRFRLASPRTDSPHAMLERLAAEGSLPRLSERWGRPQACHELCDRMDQDLKAAGLTEFTWMCGMMSCSDGGRCRHSWLEANGWVIDPSATDYVLLVPAIDYYANRRVTNTREVAPNQCFTCETIKL
jgi:hypothetical protein